MKKITILIASALAALTILASCASTSALPELKPTASMPDIYACGTPETQAAVARCDELIADAKYASALSALGSISEEDYGIKYYRTVSMYTDWFCYSMMHKMFDIQNFNSVQELLEFRHALSYGTQDMYLSIRMFDAEEYAEEMVEEYGPSPYIDLGLSHYYADVARRYGNQWLVSYDELMDLVYVHFQKAFAENVYDEATLSEYALACLSKGEGQAAIEALETLIACDPTNGAYWYNISAANMQLGNYEEAVSTIQYAIFYPEEDEEYQADAYFLLSDAYQELGKFKDAEKTLVDAEKKFPADGRVYFRQGTLALSQNKISAALDSFEKYYLIALIFQENDDDCLLDVLNVLVNTDNEQEAVRYCQNLMQYYDEDDYYRIGFNHYYRVQLYLMLNDRLNAGKEMDLAEENLINLNGGEDFIQEARYNFGL